VAAIVALGIAWGLMMHAPGWAQSSYYAQVRALADGRAEIDRWHWETQDKAWIDRHYYSVKAPGLAAYSLPAYLALDAVGGKAIARDAADAAARSDNPRWTLAGNGVMAPYETFGYSSDRAERVWIEIADGTPVVWWLTLFGAVIPAVLLLLLVRWVADRVDPGYGTAAAITLGLGTIVLTFGSEYLAHVIAAMLGFVAFAILFRERAGPGNLALVGAAGLVAGLAVTFEYPLVLAGTVIFVYALTRPERRVARGAAYAAGAVLGAIPALAFNQWAFGDPLQFAYGDAIARAGFSGHAELGLNDDGLFGITFPSPAKATDLLVSSRGLLTLTPVIAMAVVGIWLLGKRQQWRTEARVLGAVTAAYFIYNSAYWLPMGGGTPGPRFLIPALPFVAIGFATAYRRLPALTLGLAIPSAMFMFVGMITFPLLGENGTGLWVSRWWAGHLEHTVLTTLGVGNAWLAAAPVLLAIAAAIVLTALATPRGRIGEVRAAFGALLGWMLIAIVGPTVAGDPITPIDGGPQTVQLIAFAVLVSAATLLTLSYRERRSAPSGSLPGPEPALRGRIS